MNGTSRRLVWAIMVLGVGHWLFVPSPCLAQDPAAKTAPRAAPPAKPAQAEQEGLIREQSIYIPYEKLRKVFEKEGRGVFLPYEKFQELWQAAQEKTRPAQEPKPPLGCLITEAENEATVSKDVVQVKARLKIELLGEGWHEVPLRLADAAITSATLAGQPARIVPAGDAGYKLLVENQAKKPEGLDLVLEYAKAITRVPGQNSVSFQAPQAAVSRWRVRIPEAGVKVNLHPLIAASGQEAAPAARPAAPEETVVLAFVGAAPTVRIDWTPKAEGATGLEALASVQADHQVWVNEGVVRTRVHLAYTISRAELAQLALEVPAGQKVANVFDANVRQWSVQPADNQQKIVVQLFEPAKTSQNVTVELEEFVPQPGDRRIRVPVVKALGVGRQQGVVVAHVAEGLRAEATRSSGLLQVDSGDLPPALASSPWAFAYRYAAVPFELELAVEKVQPRLLVDWLVEADLVPERLTLAMSAIYTVERAGVFRLELDVPAGFELRQVRGRAGAGAAEAPVDTYYLEGDDKTHLVVNLGRKALGRVGLMVELSRELKEPDLLTPTGKAAEVSIPVPRAAVERSSGRVVVYAPGGLRVNPGKTDGARQVSIKEAMEGMESSRAPGASEPRWAFAFAHQPPTLSVLAERMKPHVTVQQLLEARIEHGVVNYKATFLYDILYSAVKSLRIDVPAPIAGLVNNETPSLPHKLLAPAPAGLAEGYVAWSFSAETELIGQRKIELAWKQNLEKLDVGATLPLTLPRLQPKDVDLATGKIVLVKTETIDINDPETASGLRPIDPQIDLKPFAPMPNAARAFAFDADWTLVLPITRYDLQEVKHTSMERAVVRMVVTRAGRISVQGLYRMRSARQRLEVRLPAEAALDAQQRIDGKPVTLEVGQAGQYFVPLATSSPDESFLLELRYSVSGDGSLLECPEFPQEPAVQKVYLCAYLPEEWALLGKRGPWSEEFGWRLEDYGSWQPVPRQTDGSLVAWVCQPLSPSESFQTDGRLYVFSALRPAGAPEGVLRLVTWHANWLNFAVIAAVVIGGLVLLPAGRPVRALAVGALVVALVAVGVFLPIFAHRVLGGILATAIFVVLVVWTVWHFARTRPLALRAPPSSPEGQGTPGQGGPNHG